MTFFIHVGLLDNGMKKKRSFWIRISVLSCMLIPFTLAGCRRTDTYPDFSEDTHPIVFQLWGVEGKKSGGLGLINPDGTDGKTYPNNSISRMPAWSPDGKKILVLHPMLSDYGFLGLVNKGIYCKGKGVFFEHMRWGSDHEILRENIDVSNKEHHVREIVLWDIDTCSISKVLYREATKEIFKYFDYSINGDIAFTREINQSKLIAIYNSNQNLLFIISIGFGATWSPDGTQIVFSGAEGLYISDGKGKSIRKAVDLTAYYPVENGAIVWDEWPPMAVWSPDGRFLLFHRWNGGTYELVKSEIATGIETVIYQGGMYPDWR
jgi:hypothetical protein